MLRSRGHSATDGDEEAKTPASISKQSDQVLELLREICTRDYSRRSVRSLEHDLLNHFTDWKDQEKIGSDTVMSLEVILKNSNMPALYAMTARELSLMHSQLCAMRTRARGHQRSSPKRKYHDDVSQAWKRRKESHITQYLEVPNLRGDAPLDTSSEASVSTELSRSSTKSAVDLKRQCAMVDRTIRRLFDVSLFCRQIAMETCFPELVPFLDGTNDNLVSEIYTSAISWTKGQFPLASDPAQTCLAASISRRATQLVASKRVWRDASFSEPPSGSLATSRATSTNSRQTTNEPSIADSRHQTSDYPELVADSDLVEPASGVPAVQLISQLQRRSAKLPSTPSSTPYLDYFICLESDCTRSLVLFNSRESWRNHLSRHHPRKRAWVCAAVQHGRERPEFDSDLAFQKHMWNAHRGYFDVSDLFYLTKACRKPTVCWLCMDHLEPPDADGTGLNWSDAFLDHIVDHFREIERQYWRLVEEYQDLRGLSPMDRWGGFDVPHSFAEEVEDNEWMAGQLKTLLPSEGVVRRGNILDVPE